MIYYKIVNTEGIISAKGTTCDGVTLPDGLVEITKEEYEAITFPEPEPPEPEEPEPTTEEQIGEIRQKQQELQETLDILLGVQENE